MRLGLPFIVLATLSSCGVFEPEGRQQTTTFTTFLTRQEVRARAEAWLTERAHYQVTRSEPAFVRAENRRPRSVGPGEQIDVLTVEMEEVAEGTRVAVQARTFLPQPGGSREQADQLSPEGGTDQAALVQVLMPRPF